MRHPWSTHRNNTKVIVFGQYFSARLQLWRERFVVTVSVRDGARQVMRVDYAEDFAATSDEQLFNYAFWTMKAVLNKIGCVDAVREEVHPDCLVLKQPFSMDTVGTWPACRMQNLSTTLTRPMEQASGHFRPSIIRSIGHQINDLTTRCAE